MVVIGLGHKARHGKNYAAKAIIQHCARQGVYAKEYGFADALKGFARVLGMRKKDGPLLQVLGTEVFRRIDPDVWVRVLVDTIEEQRPDVALITDMRFPNEVAGVRRLGGYAVKVTRWVNAETRWISPDRPATHESEIALDNYTGWDAQINVLDGDIPELNQRAVEVYELLKGQA